MSETKKAASAAFFIIRFYYPRLAEKLFLVVCKLAEQLGHLVVERVCGRPNCVSLHRLVERDLEFLHEGIFDRVALRRCGRRSKCRCWWLRRSRRKVGQSV